ncbi:glycosyltransferase [Arthrospira platensis]|nr:glycosyltransferase [Arthrospira platensis]
MRFHLEGWPFAPNCYAIATYFILKELLRRSHLQVSYQANSSASRDSNPIIDRLLGQLSIPTADLPGDSNSADISLRISPEADLTPTDSQKTGILTAPQWGTLLNISPENVSLAPNITLITPTMWCKDGLLRGGIPPHQVAVIPPGVDREIFHPLTSPDRQQLRKSLDWDYYFVFIHVSNLENTDGIRPLLKAFAAVVEVYPHARLILKGCTPNGEKLLLESSQAILTDAEARRVQPRLAYIGDNLPLESVAKLYQAADVYVSPDVAPGLNLPILEAIASGLPVIYTEGSPAQEWTHPDFGWAISSQFRTFVIDYKTRFLLHPNWEHLVTLMQQAIEQPQMGTMARELVPQFVAQRFTWKHTVDRILEVLNPSPKPAAARGSNIGGANITSHPHKLVVEGWRWLPHSYALINSHQLLELHQRSPLQLFHRDMPYVTEDWKPSRGLFTPDEEAILGSLPTPPEDLKADVTLRMYCPFNLASSDSKKTFVFGCTEWGILPQTIVRGMGVNSFREAHLNSDSIIVTASEWSRQGFLNSGAVPERLAIVPLGFDPKVHYPLNEEDRHSLRRELGWSDYFVILNIGIMWNERQGVARLLKAFAQIAESYPEARLVLKGRDAIFKSKESIKAASKQVLTDAQIDLVKPRISYLGDNLSATEIARLYKAADLYVSPYSAEGFNLPVLEAVACGTPVICTKGGPTDEFTREDFSFYINSQLKCFQDAEGDTKFYLEPDFNHLVELMENALKNPNLRTQNKSAGCEFVRARFTWSKVCDRLLEVLFSSSS